MRYRKPSQEFSALQWDGTNLAELQERFGALRVVQLDDDPQMLELACDETGLACYVQPTDWVVEYDRPTDPTTYAPIGERVLHRLTDGQFQALGAKQAYRDRNDHYVPDGLYLDGEPQYVEVSEPRAFDEQYALHMLAEASGLFDSLLIALPGTPEWDTAPEVTAVRRWLKRLRDPYNQALSRPARLARIEMAGRNPYEPDQSWTWWADMSGEPFADGQPHWSHFKGHRVQVDVELSTSNRREVNEWKGRDEIQPGGEWVIKLNRQPVYGGWVGSDVPATLREIERKVAKLTGDGGHRHGLDLTSSVPFTEQLRGRRIYYGRTPAVVSGTVLEQGCVMLKPVGVNQFPRAAYQLDDEPDGTGHDEQDLYDEYEAREIKVHIDSPDIWWHRDRPFAPGEPDGRYRRREPEGVVEVQGTLEEGGGGFAPLPPADGDDGPRESVPVEADEDEESGS